MEPGITLILYDGVCGLCNRVTQFVLKRDGRNAFRFAALQSDLARGLLGRHGIDASDLNTFYLVTKSGQPSEAILSKSDGALAVFVGLGFPWSWAGVFRVVPRSLRNAVYDFVARRRYGWFGKLDQCAIPSPGDRAKFLSN